MELQQYLGELKSLQANCASQLPTNYYCDIAYPWFTRIAPIKAEEYGTEAWESLGPKGLISEINGCFHRWQRLRTLHLDVPYAPMFDAIIDTFGYSILLHVCMGQHEVDFDPQDYPPRLYMQTIIDKGWDHDEYDGIPNMALRMAYNMWRMR